MEQTNNRKKNTDVHCLVGIGASAGGIEALQQFLTFLPSDTGMAFVIIQHLAPDHKSLLPEILSKYTSMPVMETTDSVKESRGRPQISETIDIRGRTKVDCH